MLLADQAHNIYAMLLLIMNTYLIDYILAGKGNITNHNQSELVLVVAGTLLPSLLLHCLDYARLTWKVGGTSRTTLQKSLLRKFLNYSATSRETLDQGDIIMAMTRDAPDIVGIGYMNIMVVCKHLGKIVVLFVYQASAPQIFDKNQTPIMYLPLAVFPFILIPFLLFRRERTNACEAERNRRQDKLVTRVSRTVSNVGLITDYNVRPRFVSWYESYIKKYNSAAVKTAQVMNNNNYFSPLLTLVFACSYLLIGGSEVADGDKSLSLGMFLTNLKVIYAVGNAYGAIYKTLLTMQSCFVPLERVVSLMNLPIDLPARMALSR